MDKYLICVWIMGLAVFIGIGLGAIFQSEFLLGLGIFIMISDLGLMLLIMSIDMWNNSIDG